MEVSNEQVRQALLSLVAFVVSVTFHEFSHAFVADRLGDGLPRAQGRVTLSPLAHISPVGTILIPLLSAFAPGLPLIAWGKPVQVNPAAMTRRWPASVSNLLVSIAGPLTNLLLALVVSALLLVVAQTGQVSQEVAFGVIRFVVALNISLAFFNLLPIPPLDGSAILALILPARAQRLLPRVERYGMAVLLVLFATGLGAFVMRPATWLTVAWARALLRALGFGPV